MKSKFKMQRREGLFFILLFLFFIPHFSFAQGVAVEAFLDKQTLSLDDQLVLTVRVRGGSVFTEPRIPSRGNFEVLSRGSSSSMEIINGRMNIGKEYVYVLGPKATGTFEIGPVSVEVEGKEYQTGPLAVTVVSNSAASPPMPAIPGLPSNVAPGVPLPSTEGNYKDVFVTAEVDKKNPYVGEQVIFTFRLYTSRNIGSAKLDLPDFHDFWSEEIEKENKSYKDLGGIRYVVSEFKMALFPSHAGQLGIGETTLKADVEEPVGVANNPFNDPFFTFRGGFNSRSRVLKAPEIVLQVKDLPPGAPSDFKGLVGNFKMSSDLSKKDLAVGETTTLTLTVSGSGNLKDAAISANLQIPNLKIYEDKATLDLNPTPLGLSGTKTFKWALVPDAPGHVQVPSLSLVFFDPKKGTYQTLSSDSYELAVTPGTDSEKLTKAQASLPSQNAPVNALAEDIASLHPEFKGWQDLPSQIFFYGVGLFFILPPFILLISYVLVRRKRWENENVELLKNRKALSKALGQLKKMSFEKREEVPVLVGHILKEYLGDKWGRVGVALTPLEVDQIFSKNGKKIKAGEEFAKFLQQLDEWQYGGHPQKQGWEEETRKQAVRLLKEVEKNFL